MNSPALACVSRRGEASVDTSRRVSLAGWGVLILVGGCTSPPPSALVAPPTRYLAAPEPEPLPLPPEPDPWAAVRARVHVIDAAWPPASLVDPVTLLDEEGVLRVRPAEPCWPARWEARGCDTTWSGRVRAGPTRRDRWRRHGGW